MEKKIIIDFLNEYWDELTALLPESADLTASCIRAECFPADFCEFVDLLSKLIAVYRRQVLGEQSQVPVQGRLAIYDSVHGIESLNSYHADTKGLLEKAQQFRNTDPLPVDESHSSIVVQDGLFIVQPRQYSENLDTSFKKLVDSVL